ncbi:MAG: hypothetical protein AMXMBFR23_19110 [Chloroflexota bacterium]
MLDELLRDLGLSEDEAILVRDTVARTYPLHGPADRARLTAAVGAYQDARIAGLCREGAVEVLVDVLDRTS